MELREKTDSPEPALLDTTPSDAEARRAEERLEQASRLLAAGRAAVERALSSSPDAFLKQVRQQGGQ